MDDRGAIEAFKALSAALLFTPTSGDDDDVCTALSGRATLLLDMVVTAVFEPLDFTVEVGMWWREFCVKSGPMSAPMSVLKASIVAVAVVVIVVVGVVIVVVVEAA